MLRDAVDVPVVKVFYTRLNKWPSGLNEMREGGFTLLPGFYGSLEEIALLEVVYEGYLFAGECQVLFFNSLSELALAVTLESGDHLIGLNCPREDKSKSHANHSVSQDERAPHLRSPLR